MRIKSFHIPVLHDIILEIVLQSMWLPNSKYKEDIDKMIEQGNQNSNKNKQPSTMLDKCPDDVGASK